MHKMQVSLRRLLIVALISIASFITACASEEAGPPVDVTATESVQSSESSQTDEYCILEFPESSIDETVRIGDMTFFLVNAAYRDKPFADVCQYVPVPDGSGPPRPWVRLNVELSRLADSLLFAFDVPTWAPDGFRFSGDAHLYKQEFDRYEAAIEQGKSPGFEFSTKWEDPGGDIIGLTVFFRGGAIKQRIISGSLEVPDLEVGSAALIRGYWTQVEDSMGWSDDLLTLIVDVGGNLRYHFGTTSESVTADELIRMAESMKPVP